MQVSFAMEDFDNQDKVVKLKKCYNIYTKTIEMGMRPNTHFDKAG